MTESFVCLTLDRVKTVGLLQYFTIWLLLNCFLLNLDVVMQSVQEPGRRWANTVMFSHADPLVVAVAGSDGATLYDIRNLNRL